MKFYRYKVVNVIYAKDMSGEYITSHFPQSKLELNEYVLVKETPKGYWIGLELFPEFKYKWVSKTSRKKYAYLTKEEALINFIKRTEIRMKIIEQDLLLCQGGLNKAKDILKEQQNEK